MRLRKACEHGRYERHFVTFYNMEQWSCPGGEFLPEGALVIEDLQRATDALEFILRTKGGFLYPSQIFDALAAGRSA